MIRDMDRPPCPGTGETLERDMESIERMTANREPPVPSRRIEPARDTDNLADREPDEVEIRAVQSIETEGNIFQARLSYDPFERDVFVEILDPTTGDVIRRLPAERAADEHRGLRGGAFLDRLA